MLAGRFFRPASPPAGALLVCHGAGSRKENHELMGEQAAAAGLAALTFDFRGHGESGGKMDPDGWRDAVAAGERLLAESGAPWLAARGASMGGMHAPAGARARPGLFRSLVLLCPADGESLLAGLDELENEPGERPRRAAGPRVLRAASTAPRCGRSSAASTSWRRPPACRECCWRTRATTTRCRFAHSERLAAVLAAPSALIALGEGGHHGPGRSALVARATIDWALANGAPTEAPARRR